MKSRNSERVHKRLKPKGQAIVVMMFFLAVFIIGPIGFFGYEVSTYNLAKLQMKACLDAAALAAGCSQASNNNVDFAVVQKQAEDTAEWMFERNSILGDTLLNNTTVVGSPTSFNPPAHKAQLAFQFIDPNGNIVAAGNPSGKTIRVYGSYGFVPTFQKFVQLTGVFPVTDFANGGLPQLDVVLCFDLSNSMDDFTYVFLVKRFQNSSNYADYTIVSAGGTGMHPNGNGSQQLFYAVGATASGNSTGVGMNATFPQNLDQAVRNPYTFYGRGSNANYASPANVSSGSIAGRFTDMIVDVSFMNTNTPSSDGYMWPRLDASNIGFAVEASRGNLQTQNDITSARVDPAKVSSWSWTPANWYNRYWSVANSWNVLLPIGAGAQAAMNFFRTMNNNCDAHFGLVCYATGVGAGPTSTAPDGVSRAFTSSYSSNNYPADPVGLSPMPTINIDPNDTKYNDMLTTFNRNWTTGSQLKPNGSTAIAHSLRSALRMLMKNGEAPGLTGCLGLARTNSTRAVVLFTDGLPTWPLSGGGQDQGQATSDAFTMAGYAKSAGIPIYTIGLCMVSSLQSTQNASLNASPNGGIAGRSGAGAQYFQATSANDLNVAFEAVARSLVQLVRK